jgi:hypothetical protein
MEKTMEKPAVIQHTSKLVLTIMTVAPLLALGTVVFYAGQLKQSVTNNETYNQQIFSIVKVNSDRLTVMENRQDKRDILDSLDRKQREESLKTLKDVERRLGVLEWQHRDHSENLRELRPYSQSNIFKSQLEMPK